MNKKSNYLYLQRNGLNLKNQIVKKTDLGPTMFSKIFALSGFNIRFGRLSQYFEQLSGYPALLFKRILTNSIISAKVRSSLRLNKREFLIDIKSFKGLRYSNGLPAHGQRTHTNAKTSRRLRN